MPKLDDQHVILGLRNASADTLLYVCQRYFQSTRRWLRKKGVPDADTPRLFSSLMVGLVRSVQEKKLTGPIDFEALLSNAIDSELENFRSISRKPSAGAAISPTAEVASRCFHALDPDARRLIEAYHLEGLNFEELAVRFGYGNASIAEFEVSRHLAKLEGLVHISLEQ